jgi:hypothetical protein
MKRQPSPAGIPAGDAMFNNLLIHQAKMAE